jgi:hypothetical protein
MQVSTLMKAGIEGQSEVREAYTSRFKESSCCFAERLPAASRRLTGSLDEPGIAIQMICSAKGGFASWSEHKVDGKLWVMSSVTCQPAFVCSSRR